ncbi:MAG: ATP-dependent helicase, partial [Methylacidiphilales bacterium]|nr:ATP-dependent helicase [Candidatus Methylacidiphilales bacterium]
LLVKTIRNSINWSPNITFSEQYHLASQIAELSDLTKSLGFSHTHSDEQLEAQNENICMSKIDVVLEEKIKEVGLLTRYSLKSSIPRSDNKNFPKNIFFEEWIPLWKHLTTLLWDKRIITLEDQKYWALHLLKNDEDTQQWLKQQKITHVMVDEFQDINYLDLYLICQIVHVSKSHLYIVGDDDQCIYEWRGCSPDFIRDPDRHLSSICNSSGFETILLERNYRCPCNVIEHSLKLISNNQSRLPKRIIAVQSQEANIRILSFPTAYFSMQTVVKLVASFTKKHPQHSIAILGRKKCQLVPIQVLLNKQGVRFHIDEDLNIFLAPAFSSFKEVLSLIPTANQSFDVSTVIKNFMAMLDRAYRYPVSKRERPQIMEYLQNLKPKTLNEAVNHFARYRGNFKGDVSPKKVADKLERLLHTHTVKNALMEINESMKGFEKDFRKSREDIFHSDPPFSFLIDLANDYESDFSAFIKDIEKTINSTDRSSDKSSMVELMTAFRAKGREFDTVIILDANETIWPTKMAVERGYLEEERRLFYMAVTRARNNLLLVVSDRIQGEVLPRSRFIDELELPESAWVRKHTVEMLSLRV